nr:MAG TPA: hypothetical protein [Ackermannviridae sp.]
MKTNKRINNIKENLQLKVLFFAFHSVELKL